MSILCLLILSWCFLLAMNGIQADTTGNDLYEDLLPKECGRRFETRVSPRISGGVKSTPGRYPWIAAVFFNSREPNSINLPHCGGSIIDKSHILTAGHCCDPNKPVSVRVGEFSFSKTFMCQKNGKCSTSVQDLEVDSIKIHPLYKVSRIYGWAHNDICLLRLKGEISFNEYVQPSCLPKSETNGLQTGTVLRFSGWGKTSIKEQSEVLLEGNMTLISSEECERKLPPVLRHDSSSEICVQGKNMKPCPGDSGGPLVHQGDTGQFTVWGIASYSTENLSDPGCSDSAPAVFADVSKYLGWIHKNIGH